MHLLAKRGTRSQVDASASGDELLEGELIYLTDEAMFAYATSSSTYVVVGSGVALREYDVVTASTLTIQPSDHGSIKFLNRSAGTTIEVPDIGSGGFDPGTQVDFFVTSQSGTNTFVASGGATLFSSENLTSIVGRGAAATLVCGSTFWALMGKLQ